MNTDYRSGKKQFGFLLQFSLEMEACAFWEERLREGLAWLP